MGLGSLLQGKFITLPQSIQDKINTTGIRNSHHVHCTDRHNQAHRRQRLVWHRPPFLFYDRTIQDSTVILWSVGRLRLRLGIKGRTANEISADEHVNALKPARCTSTPLVKTCNVGDDVSYDEFGTYYQGKRCKGITTFRSQRYGILNEANDNAKAEACFIDSDRPEECDDRGRSTRPHGK